MKKIGILTFHKSINYGSLLQAWALRNVLNDYETFVIDYEPDAYRGMYALFSKQRRIKSNVNRLFNCVAIKRQIIYFSKFRKSYLNCTEKYKSHNLKHDSFESFDAVITGSDQIWNVRARDADDAYFVPFQIAAKKIAYACSVNDTDFSENRCDDKLRNYILDYDFISIREVSGAQKVSEFINNQKKVYTMLDPTLLNTKEAFDAITSKRLIQRPYIFLYNVWSGMHAVNAAKKISNITGLPVYTAMMDSRIKQILKIEMSGVKVETVHTAPEDFLSLIKYSEMVVTDSFHGTAFSLIFEKKFVCINDKKDDGHFKNDERIVNILEIVDLLDRYITIDDIPNFNFKEEIDYTVVTEKRMKEASICKEMLIGAIEGKVKS